MISLLVSDFQRSVWSAPSILKHLLALIQDIFSQCWTEVRWNIYVSHFFSRNKCDWIFKIVSLFFYIAYASSKFHLFILKRFSFEKIFFWQNLFCEDFLSKRFSFKKIFFLRRFLFDIFQENFFWEDFVSRRFYFKKIFFQQDFLLISFEFF